MIHAEDVFDYSGYDSLDEESEVDEEEEQSDVEVFDQQGPLPEIITAGDVPAAAASGDSEGESDDDEWEDLRGAQAEVISTERGKMKVVGLSDCGLDASEPA